MISEQSMLVSCLNTHAHADDAHTPTHASRQMGKHKHTHSAHGAIKTNPFVSSRFNVNTGQKQDFASLFPKYSGLVMPESCSAGEPEHRPEELC